MKLQPKLRSEITQPKAKRNSTTVSVDTELKITKISQQVKRNDRYSIYINEKYSFSLSEYQLAGSGLRLGKVFTQNELDTLIQESSFGKAYERALNYVMIRPRSEREIKDYLTRTFLYPKPRVYTDKAGKRHIKPLTVDKEQTIAMIERVLGRLSEKGYINDEVFAKAWINSRQLTKKSSKRKLQQELRAKNVDPEIIATLLQNEDFDEKHNLAQIVTKKQRLSKYQDSTKLTHYLLRQGFNYEDVKEALSGDE